jgi:uncharacterized Zn-binding protein involved in type VI secretion
MPAAQRQGDPNTGAGFAVSGVDSVRINGKPVVVPGTVVTPHPRKPGQYKPPIHFIGFTSGGVSSVRAGGKPINVDGDTDICIPPGPTHKRIAGSNDVFVGGRGGGVGLSDLAGLGDLGLPGLGDLGLPGFPDMGGISFDSAALLF